MCWLVVPESAPNATNPKGLALQAATRLGREKYQFSWRDIEGEEEVEGEEQTVSPS